MKKRNLVCMILIVVTLWGCTSSTIKKTTDQEHTRAQYDLGMMYARGRGVTQDYKTAAQWYQKAADQGYARAQYSLGRMYENGYGAVSYTHLTLPTTSRV